VESENRGIPLKECDILFPITPKIAVIFTNNELLYENITADSINMHIVREAKNEIFSILPFQHQI
jgi:hypothetical protein